MPDTVIDTPVDPPIDEPLARIDPKVAPEIKLTQHDPWTEDTGEKHPRVLRLGRGGAMVIKMDETVMQGLTKDFTLELWVMPLGKSQPQIVSMNGFRLSVQNGYVRLDTAGEPLHGPELRSRDWHHIAIVVVNQQLTLYVNGTRGGTTTVDEAWAPSGASVTVGLAEGSTLGPFVGEIDNLRLAQGARYNDAFLPSTTFIPADTYFAYDFNGTSRGAIVLGNPGPSAKLTGTAQLMPGSI